MGVRDWLTHHRYHRRHRCPTFDDVTATLMGVRDDVMTGNHYKVQKDYCDRHKRFSQSERRRAA